MTTPQLMPASVDPVSAIAGATAAPSPTTVRPPARVTGPVGWVRANLFGSVWAAALTIVLAVLIGVALVDFVQWAFVDAIWSVPTVDGRPHTEACRAEEAGACWALIGDKYRFILFGTYAYDQQWRPAVCVALFVGLYAVSAIRRFWRRELLAVWLLTLVAIGVLMWGGTYTLTSGAVLLVFAGLYAAVLSGRLPGWAVAALLVAALLGLNTLGGADGLGVDSFLEAHLGAPFQAVAQPVRAAKAALRGVTLFGMPFVPHSQWGGLPVTLILATFGLAFAFPLSVLVALGRRARTLPAVRTVCIVYVELIRGVPLVSLLFMASVMFPLFLPQGVDIDKLLRAQVAFILFAAAYLSEVVRAGLQALPRGQYEAADALGLSYWKKTGLIILPQALRLVIPPLVNTFIGFFKDTSLVVIIGIFDLTNTGKTAVADPAWQGFGRESYIFIGLIYFAFCFAMAKYSRKLEHDLGRSAQR